MSQVVASGDNFFLTWGDDRNGKDPDVYMAMIPAAGGLPDFPLSAGQASWDILPGDTVAFQLNTGSTAGMTAGVKFSATVYPASGITTQFAGNTLTAASTASTVPGTYTITATGDTGSIQRSTELRVT